MENYSEKELEDCLRRAFVDHRADYIILDDRRQGFLLASADLGERNGWLESEFHDNELEQYSYLKYRLTSEGKKYFGVT